MSDFGEEHWRAPETKRVIRFAKALKESRIDPLTGVGNRRLFEEEARKTIARAERSGEDISILFADVDGLKKINDVFGHAAGDVTLKFLANTLKLSSRTQDTVAKYGGDEFIILLPNTDEEAAKSMSKRIQTSLNEALNKIDATNIPPPDKMSFSIGCATWKSGDDMKETIKEADTNMYTVKRDK